ncbi:hypothetical protein LINPERHAP2_LOCUS5886, partial [Linum perenne]
PSNDDVGYEEPRRLEDDDPLEEVRDDLETLQEEVAPRVEHESEQHHPIMVPPKIVSTLQSSCLIMKYLCQETDTSFITSPKVIMEEEPSMCEPEDSLGGITNLETMEL